MSDRGALLCGHAQAPLRRGRRLTCPACRSYRDLDAAGEDFHYGDDYPEARRHFEAAVGSHKSAALERWLRHCGLDPRGHVVCETGFGGGHTLARMRELGAVTFGVEVVDANLAHAASLGVPREGLFKADARPARLPRPVDLWLFLDSFEHLPDPAAYVDWLSSSSSPRAAVLVVAPRADSPSNALLGPLWPHRLPDHPFHWSREGLTGFFARRGFSLRRSFFPWKRVTPGMVAMHLRHQRGWSSPAANALVDFLAALPLSLPFNVGEMGLLFERNEHPS